MQTRQITRLARKLRSTHRRTKSWRATAKEHHILTPTGEVNPGLAQRIALNGYQPSDETIARLIKDGAIEAKKKHIAPKMINDMTSDELATALRNRFTMPDPNYSPTMMRAFVKACKSKRIIQQVPA